MGHSPTCEEVTYVMTLPAPNGLGETGATRSKAYIDQSTAFEVIHYLRATRIGHQLNWTTEGAFNTTYLLMASDHVHVTGTPVSPRSPSGPFSILLRSLQQVLGFEKASALTSHRAELGAKSWARRNIPKLHAFYREIVESSDYQRYLDIPIDIWVDHTRRLGGMFDGRFVGVTASVLGAPEAELRTLLAATRDEASLPSLLSESLAPYVVSQLVEGRYHYYLAKGRYQVVIHPIREGVYPALTNVVDIPSSQVLWHLCAIALNRARQESSLDARIQTWADITLALRSHVQAGLIALGNREKDGDNIDTAVKGAAFAGVDAPSKSIRAMVDFGLPLLGGAITTVAFSPWLAVPAAALLGLVTDNFEVSRRASQKFGYQRRVRDLAQAPPGRIRPMWR